MSLAFAAFGCGSDSKDASEEGTGGQAGPAAGNGGPGSGGSTGGGSGGSTSTGSGGSASAPGGTGGGAAMVAPVACGSATCEPDPTIGLFARPCCVDEATSTCGTMLSFSGGGMCAAPVDPDPRCESVMVMSIASLTLPSCCTEDNRCGITFAMFGMAGCTSLEEAAAIAMGDGGVPDGGMGGGVGMNPFNVALPEPRACE